MVKVVVVEKRGAIGTLLGRRFPKDKVSVDAASAIDAVLNKPAPGNYDLLIWDADASGPDKLKAFELLETFSIDSPDTQIVVVGTRGDVNLAADDAQARAYRWISRPVDEDELWSVVDSALQKRAGGDEAGAADRDIHIPVELEGIIAVSLSMRAIIQRVMEASSADIPVLITGETGTGKDLVAAAIHKRSKRKEFPYIPVHTGAMSPELIASELFGYEKGAYTGAFETHRGVFEEADRGTIFLDEISTMDEKTQVSLLRVVETKAFRRVGGTKGISVDVRVIAATNENLEEAMKDKRFREDLYYRLDVFRIHLPPLRDRPGGIALLADHFVSYFNALYKKNVQQVSPETYRHLTRYAWPGNVRELKGVIQRAILMAKGEELTADLIPPRIIQMAESNADSAAAMSPIRVGMTLDAVEKEFIAMTLASTGGNKKEAALILRISRRALYNKLKKHGLL